jgi:hypothetical protein
LGVRVRVGSWGWVGCWGCRVGVGVGVGVRDTDTAAVPLRWTAPVFLLCPYGLTPVSLS